MSPEEILAACRAKLGDRLLGERTVERLVGTVAPRPVYDVWITIDRSALRDAVEHLCTAHAAHLTVISGDDLGEEIAFNYHFTIGWGERFGETTLSVRTVVPKADLRLPSICDLLPGAQTSEREKHEFFGIEIVGIPDDRNLFLPEGMALHPWRKDLEAQTAKSVKRLVKWEARDG